MGIKKISTGFTREEQESFIMTYFENNFNLTKTCKILNMTLSSFYHYYKNKTEFRAKLDLSLDFLHLVINSAIVEGLTNEDINMRLQYLKVIPPAIINKRFGINNNIDDVLNKFELNKEDFIK